MKLILASNSPRRKELLSMLGVPFEVRTLSGIDESFPSSLRGVEIPLHIAAKKAEAYKASMAEDEIIITADTIVYLESQTLGKPADASEAHNMLSKLSGKTHEVITGVSIVTNTATRQFAVTTRVTFAELTSDMIDYYITNYRPFDKAGAYGIQEWIGAVGITGIEGSYYNVVGLPVQRLATELMNMGLYTFKG